MHDRLPDRGTIVPVIWASNKTHLTKFSSDQQAWPLYLMLGNTPKDMRHTPTKRTWILVGLISCPPKAAKNTQDTWPSAVGTVLSSFQNLDITGPDLNCDCADGFEGQCHPLLAAWVMDYPEQVMVTQVSYGSCLMFEIPQGVPMWHSTFRALDNPSNQHYCSELLDGTNNNVADTLGVHAMRNQFWQFPLCYVYRHWQPDELHQLLLGLVKDLLHWLLKYLKARNVKDQFDKRFTSVSWYPGLQYFSTQYDSMKSGY